MKNCIETERLIIRPIKITDAEDIFEYAKDEETGPRAGWPPHQNIEDTIKVINMWLSPDCSEHNFAIVYKPHNKVVGTIGYTFKERNQNNTVVQELIANGKYIAEIGFVVSKQYQGKGIATESLNNIIDYIFLEEDVDIIITCHSDLNYGSGRVQDKCNMKIIGNHQYEKPWYNTNSTNHIVRAKTREEWRQEKRVTINFFN